MMIDRQAVIEQARELEHLGTQAFRNGDATLACHRYERAIALYESVGDTRSTTQPLIHLSNIAFRQQDWPTTYRALQRLVGLMGVATPNIWILRRLGIVAEHLSYHDAARHYFVLAHHLMTQEMPDFYPRDLLWEWGQFEYKHGDRESGIDLCRLALVNGMREHERPLPNGDKIEIAETYDDWKTLGFYLEQIARMENDL